MSQLLTPVIWYTVGIFIIAFIVQLVFPVEVYEKARESDLSTVNKGRFAYTVESLYQIKTKGFQADRKHWWHVVWFNTAASLIVSGVIAFWTPLVIVGLIIGIFASLRDNDCFTTIAFLVIIWLCGSWICSST